MAGAERDIQEGLHRGQPDACEALVRAYRTPVYRLLWAEMGDAEDAADLTQETFLVAWRRADQAARADNLEAWLYGIALRRARKLRSRIKRRRNLAEVRRAAEDEFGEPEGDGPEKHLELAELLGTIWSLAPKYRHPLLLFAIKGLSHREIAQALGLSEDCARWRVSEARRQLRSLIGDDPEREEDGYHAARADV
jgi:RNA polymerase sigma factor (sigma-70 family)